MFQRCISFLVIAGLFAGQLAALPHAHGGISAADQKRHNATPHFHGDWLGHVDHDHGHSHGGHRHAHAKPPIEKGPRPSDNSDDQSLTVGLSDDHDASAIFVPRQASAPSITSQEGSASAASQLATLVPPTVGVADSWPSLSSTPRWHPPDEVLDASDTYLTLRNLRI